jgi:hypothetical protein
LGNVIGDPRWSCAWRKFRFLRRLLTGNFCAVCDVHYIHAICVLDRDGGDDVGATSVNSEAYDV